MQVYPLHAQPKFTLRYLASPDVYTVRGLIERNMYLGDIPMHDTVRELILLNQSRISQQDIKQVDVRLFIDKRWF